MKVAGISTVLAGVEFACDWKSPVKGRLGGAFIGACGIGRE